MVEDLRFTQDVIRLRWRSLPHVATTCASSTRIMTTALIAFHGWIEDEGPDVIVVVASFAESTWYKYQ